MALRDDEKRALAQIQRQLADDDPRFVARLSRKGSLFRIPRRVLFTAALLTTYAVGLLAIVIGVTLPSALLVIVGALVTAGFPTAVAVRAWRGRRFREDDVFELPDRVE
ncbi:DUF3040 domain-containing protein [Saccharothrix sp. 6-C]|uniref:DUF3040 family protein n=1 Tax=Saccharothrix texasensis TaxID=103734 RepID=A0A3N1HIF4_9PSEU|nr:MULTISPECIES: DUF3040 domain-containing protein [Saccharothrix]QQQ74019.1 DUF3040 domain-containing protein [Saccharothrix sp. 6-C]ROP42082.1 DUF3040 family protein [Saccharothrix texasensis]